MPGWVSHHAKSLLLRGVCQRQEPDALFQTFHQQWHLLFSQAGPAAMQAGGSFSNPVPSFCHHPYPRHFLGVIDCCPSLGLHGL